MSNDAKIKNKVPRLDMSGAKNILFFAYTGLTALLSSSIFTNVESKENNSLKANSPDNAGELRSREARTASFERHTSPALSGFFVRRARRVGAL